MRSPEPPAPPMYRGTVWMLNALAVLGIVASPLVTVLVFVLGKQEDLPPPVFPFILLSGLTASLVLRTLAILVQVAADVRRRLAEQSKDR